MKILLVNKFHYRKGGSETYYFELGKALKNRGFDVIYFSMQDDRNSDCTEKEFFVKNIDYNKNSGPIQTICSAAKLLYSFEAKSKFKKLLLKEKPDIIHLNIFQSQLTGSIIDVAKKFGIPMVYTAHDLKSVCPNYQMLNGAGRCQRCIGGNYYECAVHVCMKNSILKSVLASLESYTYKALNTYKKIDYVITPSAFYKEILEKSGVFCARIEHLCNFLPDLSNQSVLPNDTKEDYFLYCGRLSREKGILTLVKAFQKANTSRPLYIVGEGPMYSEIEQLIQNNGLVEKIKLLGYKTGNELETLKKNCFCYCLPSEWYENCPYAVMEGMAYGKPAIVSELGGLPELVANGITGFVVPSGNVAALAVALSSSEKKEWNSQLIFRRAIEQFGTDHYLDRLLEIYGELIAEKRKDKKT